jgi:hypothetical protein
VIDGVSRGDAPNLRHFWKALTNHPMRQLPRSKDELRLTFILSVITKWLAEVYHYGYVHFIRRSLAVFGTKSMD